MASSPVLHHPHEYVTSPEDESLDPRIQVELEKLNKASDDINSLELDLDGARSSFRSVLTDSTQTLNALSKKLSKSIDNARPYYEARLKAREAQAETQRVALKFERACSMHEAAKEMVQLAELGHMKKGEEFDPAWQEMLNHATMKVNEAEKERNESEAEHMKSALAYNDIDQRVQRLQKELKRSVAKSRPYFELKARCNQILEEKKRVVSSLEEQVSSTKSIYASALRNLEEISDEIHRNRMERRMQQELGIRGAGVGAESPSPPPARNKATMENYHQQSRACRSESDVSAVVNPSNALDSHVYTSPEKSRRRSYRLAIDRSIGSPRSPSLPVSFDPSMQDANVEFRKPRSFSKQESLPERYPEALSFEETYKALPSASTGHSAFIDNVSTGKDFTNSVDFERAIYNPFSLSVDEYFKRYRPRSVGSTKPPKHPESMDRLNRGTSCPLPGATNALIGREFLHHPPIQVKQSNGSAGKPGFIKPTDSTSTRESISNVSVRDTGVIIPSSPVRIEPLKPETTDFTQKHIPTEESQNPVHESECVNDRGDDSSTLHKYKTRKSAAGLSGNVASDSTVPRGSPSTPHRAKLQGVILKINPGPESSSPIHRSLPMAVPSYYGRSTRGRGRVSRLVQSDRLHSDTAISTSLPDDLEKGPFGNVHIKRTTSKGEKRKHPEIDGEKSRKTSIVGAEQDFVELTREIEEGAQLSMMAERMVEELKSADRNKLMPLKGAEGNLPESNDKTLLSPVSDISSHKTVVRKRSQDILRTMEMDDDDMSDTDSVTSGGPMMDDDTLNMLTLTFDDSLNVDDNRSEWKCSSLPENLRYLQPYL